jgi:hypothetical protein
VAHQCPGTTTTGRRCARMVSEGATCGQCHGREMAMSAPYRKAMFLAADAVPLDERAPVSNLPMGELRVEAHTRLDALSAAAEDYYRLRAKAGDDHAHEKLARHRDVDEARRKIIPAMRDRDVLDEFADELHVDTQTYRRRTAELAAVWQQADRDPHFLADDLC